MEKTQISKSDFQKAKQLMDEIWEELETSKTSTEVHNRLEEIKEILESESQKRRESFGMAVQVSLYPLRVSSLSPFIDDAINIFEMLGLDMIPGSMSTVVYGDSKTLWRGLEEAFASAAAKGEAVMTVTVSNACPIPESLK